MVLIRSRSSYYDIYSQNMKAKGEVLPKGKRGISTAYFLNSIQLHPGTGYTGR
jgi:hypothetical protein